MGHRLVRELIDHRPSGLSLDDYVILLEIADSADDDTRQCFGGAETFARLMGSRDKSNNRRGFNRLASARVEVRVPVGTKRDGSPLYAARGKAATFRFPVLCTNPDADGFHDRDRCFPGERRVVVPVQAAPADGRPIDADELAPAVYVREIRDVRTRVNAETLRMWSAAAIRRALADAVRHECPADEAREALRSMAELAHVRAPGFLTGSNAGMEADWFALARRPRVAAASSATAAAGTTDGPKCDYVDDPGMPGWCSTCHMPEANARHRKESGTVLPFRSDRAKRPA